MQRPAMAAETERVDDQQAIETRRQQLQRSRDARQAQLHDGAGLAVLAAIEIDLAQVELARFDAAAAGWSAVAAAAGRAAGTAAAALLAQRFGAGQIELQGDGSVQRLAAVRQVPPLAPGRWVQALACGWLAGDAAAVAVLADAANVAAVFEQGAAAAAPAAYRRPWCELLAALARGASPKALAAYARHVAAAVQSDLDAAAAGAGELHPDPEWLQAAVLDLLPAIVDIGAGAARSAARLDAAAAADARYGRQVADELLPLPSLLVAGLRSRAQPSAAPPAADAASVLTFTFAPQAAANAAEIHWWLDGLGAPRAGRSHRLLQHAGSLRAEYRIAWPAVPGATACFTLDDDARLLEPAQLAAVAASHAAAVPAAPAAAVPQLREQRYHLAEAVGCLDLALRRGAGGSTAAIRNEYRRLLAAIDQRLAAAA